MEKIADKHKRVFEGMGRAKVDPIHIQMDPNAIPVYQGKRSIPPQFKDRAIKKLQEMKENDLIEGRLPPEECKGWIHNLVITKKSWNNEEVRINVDTKRMNEDIVQTKIPIPTTEELRHGLEGSDRFTVVDARDSFFHFLLDQATKC